MMVKTYRVEKYVFVFIELIKRLFNYGWLLSKHNFFNSLFKKNEKLKYPKKKPN